MVMFSPLRRLVHRWSRPGHRGQSLVEFALTLPIVLLIVVGTVDLGRAYFMTENITNAVKEGAFFGARSPSCDTDVTPGCANPANVHFRVEQELNGVNLANFEAKCFDPGTTDFSTSGKALVDCEDGDIYYVAATTTFDLITPIIANLVGSQLTLGSSATSIVLTDFESSGTVIIPSASASPTLAPGTCLVPNFMNGTKLNQAQGVWTTNGGFSTTVTTVGPSGQAITWQSLPPNYVGSCTTTTITVSNSPQATPTPSPSASPTATPSASGSSSASPSASATPQTMCTIPQLVRSPKISITQAQGVWTAAGFSAANFSAVRPPNNDYNVSSQSVQAGLSKACLTTTITVDN